jgi:phosphopantothenoylcysteine decarboxylase / phosphopantothenate---cysteine ligase
MKLAQKKILVAVTGGIAAYKTCSLVNSLIGKGAEVRVVMTEGAKKFVTPLTFQALTNHSVYDDLWRPEDLYTIEHITISHWPDLIVISPATANTIAKMAHGIADNLLTTIVLASLPDTKILLAPAMNTNMWNNQLVQRNIKILLETKKFFVVEPRSGILACRDEGKGKVAEVEDIIKQAESLI